MKRIRSQVEYKVPHWSYCNSDSQDFDNVGKYVCKFCKKTKGGAECLLYDCSLSTDGQFIDKTRRCIQATAGIKSTIVSDSVESRVTVEPKKIIKQAVSLYIKTFNDLLNQGYPRQMAESIAKEYMSK